MPKDSGVMWSRREAISLLGAGTGAGLVSLVMGETNLEALRQNSAAIIRTVLDDVSPEALGTGATLFHEHLSMTDEFVDNLRPPGSPPGTRMKFYDDVDLIVDEVRAAGEDGVTCIVDGGHADMGEKSRGAATHRVTVGRAYRSWRRLLPPGHLAAGCRHQIRRSACGRTRSRRACETMGSIW